MLGANFLQNGGAIANYGTLTFRYGNFTGNSASYVSQQRKKPSLTSPFARKMLEIPGWDIIRI